MPHEKLRLLPQSPPEESPAATCPPSLPSSMRGALPRWLQRQEYQDIDLLTALLFHVDLGKRTGTLPSNWTLGDWVAWALRRQLSERPSQAVNIPSDVMEMIEDNAALASEIGLLGYEADPVIWLRRALQIPS